MTNYIPLSSPSFIGNEWKYVKRCLDEEWVSQGEFVEQFETRISQYTGSSYAIACINGTSALHISLLLAGVKPGDEVIAPSLTFIAPINAIAYCSAQPVFMDSDEYFNIDIEKTIDFIREETEVLSQSSNTKTVNKSTGNEVKAIVVVHTFGNAVFMDDLVEICDERNIKIIEDASESLGTFYNSGVFKKRHTGTIGFCGCLSFNGNKIITTGGGGIILSEDKNISDEAKYLINQAKDDAKKYIHNQVGYNYRMTNLQAALGVAQLENLPKFLDAKRKIFLRYCKGVYPTKGLSINPVPKFSSNNHWLNILRIEEEQYGRGVEKLLTDLEEQSIEARRIWFLNHLQKPFKHFQSYKISKAFDLVNSSLCLPSSNNLEDTDLERIISVLTKQNSLPKQKE